MLFNFFRYLGRGVRIEFRGRMVNMGEVYRILGILVLWGGVIFKMIDLKWVEAGGVKSLDRVMKLITEEMVFLDNSLNIFLKQVLIVSIVVLLLIWFGD